MSTWLTFPSKSASEGLKLPFDFASRLGEGETISTASATAALFSGEDALPSAILSGSASISGTIVTQKVVGGTVGNIYLLSCVAGTSASQTLFLQGLLAITAEVV